MQLTPLYHNSILAGAITTAVLALCLFFVKPPRTRIYSVYRRSKIILGIGYAAYALGISVFVMWPGLRVKAPHMAVSVNLTYYFAAAFLFGSSFIALLSPGFVVRRRMMRYMATYVAYVALLWSSTFTLPDYLLQGAHVFFVMWFVVQALILIRVFLRAYRHLRSQLDNNYADTTVTFIRWLNNSAWCVIVFGVLCGVSTFFSPLWVALLMCAGILVFIYIYISMQNYALHLSPVQYVAENPIETPKESSVTFAPRLEQWIGERGYCNDHMTLDKLARYVGTNRTYLSSYINTQYNQSFSEWVNGMRLTYARDIMTEDSSVTLAELAQRCGFSSVSYFSKLFKQAFGISPSLYRGKM